MSDCIFCELSKNTGAIIRENDLAYAVYDHKPITKGHALIITKNHFKDVSETEDKDLHSVVSLMKETASYLRTVYPEIKGFNYISNQGKEAKQVVFHLHFHIIPRY